MQPSLKRYRLQTEETQLAGAYLKLSSHKQETKSTFCISK